MVSMKSVIIISSIIIIVLSLISMLFFENKLNELGTYESMNLLYMLISQALCGLGFIGIIIGLVLKN